MFKKFLVGAAIIASASAGSTDLSDADFEKQVIHAKTTNRASKAMPVLYKKCVYVCACECIITMS
jgi:hypothetical protein